MKLLWRGTWLEVPRYAQVAGSRLIRVERTASLADLPHASGRVIERSARKLLRFLLSDGPVVTARKARAKLAEPRFMGDYRLLTAFGRCPETGKRYVCIAPRMPPCAEFLLVHEGLCREIGPGFSRDRFDRFSRFLAEQAEDLARLGKQTYLYSGEVPPRALAKALDHALDASASSVKTPAVSSMPPVCVPPHDGRDTTLMRVNSSSGRRSEVPVAVLGAGDYVRSEVGPALRRGGLDLVALCDREPQVAALAARGMGFQFATTDAVEAVGRLERPGLVIVATNHDSHAELASLALEAGHRVLLEKPTVVTSEDLELLISAEVRARGRLEVGYNRRSSRLLRRARRLMAEESGPFTIVCTIREVDIEPDHWYLWPNQGSRVAGNLCHWIDLSVFLMRSSAEPVSVTISRQGVTGPMGIDAERSFAIEFNDGSLVCLIPTSRGDGLRGVQEFIEARRGGLTVRLDDLWRMSVLHAGRVSRRRCLWRDRGHQRMYRELLERVQLGQPAAYPARDLALVGAIQIASSELARSGEVRREVGAVVQRALQLAASDALKINRRG